MGVLNFCWPWAPRLKGFILYFMVFLVFFFILPPVAFGHTVSGRFFLSVVAWSSFPLFIHSDDGRHLKPKLCTKWTVNHVRCLFFWMWHLKYWKIVVNRFVKNHHETRHVCLHALGFENQYLVSKIQLLLNVMFVRNISLIP